MAIIQKKIADKKDKLKVEINSKILSQIKEYCAWANVDDLGFFIEESAQFVFSKDKKWKEHQRKSTGGSKD
jgi:hypothetical protein